MSKTTDGKRAKAARAKFREAERKWNAAVRLARSWFWTFQAIKYPNRSRFKEGTDRAKHLRGYWDQIEDIAREKFGGVKPRPLPRKQGLQTGHLVTGHL